MSVGIGLSHQQHARGVRGAVQQAERVHAHAEITASKATATNGSGRSYRQSVAVQPLVELALGLYFTATVFYALANRIYATVPFLVLFQVGFLYTGLLSLDAAVCGRRRRRSGPEVRT